jgi:dimethylargininase
VCADRSVLDTSPPPVTRAVPEEDGAHVVLLGAGPGADGRVGAAHGRAFAEWGFDVVVVDIGEFEPMEGGVTCLCVHSTRARPPAPPRR